MDTRNPKPDELPKLIAQISKAFSYNKDEGDVSKDFPQLYNSSNSKHLWASFEGEKLVAHAGYYPTVMRVENRALPVIGIGGVYTEAEFQGQGNASKLIQNCCDQGAKEGAALAFLWSDKHEFYAKQGFFLTGRQWTVELDPKDAPKLRERGEKSLHAKDIRVVEGDSGAEFLAQSKRLLDSYPIGISRTEEEHKNYLSSGSCKVISAWAGKELVGYFLVGKGKDLQNYIHEWAGAEGALHHLMAECLETFQVKLFLLSPQFMPDEVNWIYILDEMGFAMRAEYMGLVKILNFEKVKKLVGEYLQSVGLNPADLELAQAGEKFSVVWRKDTKLEFAEKDFVRFLFGPDMPAHPELKAFLPLRLWYWGMDSV